MIQIYNNFNQDNNPQHLVHLETWNSGAFSTPRNVRQLKYLRWTNFQLCLPHWLYQRYSSLRYKHKANVPCTRGKVSVRNTRTVIGVRGILHFAPQLANVLRITMCVTRLNTVVQMQSSAWLQQIVPVPLTLHAPTERSVAHLRRSVWYPVELPVSQHVITTTNIAAQMHFIA